ncbi:MAG: hypothetical protein A3K19_30120 [Lentisphaerae bacterium RIFOXYB12_FULL_65_16]|nr:MAG: hypothetical protein A3K18_18885 [Lentisphaerae bacterium RIFOXYA12_64_32]OGV85766.1 MAG: hypothetical protein A3K19_30120 [Lentisphaerae bacterium RIFOXYB12_FULL_65_16]
MQEAFLAAGLSCRVSVVPDGVEAMAYLCRQGKYAAAIRPDLIVLDLKLPRKSGREVLEEIRPDPDLSEIPLVVLSSSRSELELARPRTLPGQCCMAKPSTFGGYLELVRAIEAFRREHTVEAGMKDEG